MSVMACDSVVMLPARIPSTYSAVVVAPAAADEMGVDDRLVLDPFGDVQRRVVVHVGVLLLFKVVYLGEGHLY